MSKKVTIIDYGLGNLFSVAKAFEHVGAEVKISADAGEIKNASCLVLPGVGAFGRGMDELASRELIAPIQGYAKSGKPLLGICLGMQMLMEIGEENGTHQGLRIISGKVSKIPTEAGIKIPHIGWGKISAAQNWQGTILENTPAENSFYFVHSYQAVCKNPANLLATVDYGAAKITAAIRAGNIFGCQFHPEKSGESGLAICKKFLGM